MAAANASLGDLRTWTHHVLRTGALLLVCRQSVTDDSGGCQWCGYKWGGLISCKSFSPTKTRTATHTTIYSDLKRNLFHYLINSLCFLSPFFWSLSSLFSLLYFPLSLPHLPHLSLLFLSFSFSSIFASYSIHRSSLKFGHRTFYDTISYIPSNLAVSLIRLLY